MMLDMVAEVVEYSDGMLDTQTSVMAVSLNRN